MAVELRNVLTRSLGTSLPATLLFDYPSLDALASFLTRVLQLLPETSSPDERSRPDVVDPLASLTDEEAEALAARGAGRRRRGRWRMSDTSRDDQLSPVKRALIDLRALRARVAELEAREHEPMAIIGMSVRAPGRSHRRGELRRPALVRRRCHLGDSRQTDGRSRSGSTSRRTRRARCTRATAGFSGTSPDSMQSSSASRRSRRRAWIRSSGSLLELAWEALEHAGIAPSSLAGTRAGVYLGIANGDYGRALSQPSGAHRSVLQPG